MSIFDPLIKTPEDFFLLHPKVFSIYGELASMCMRRWNVYPTITSMLRKKDGDSGVHQTGRAIDVSRHQYNSKRQVVASLSDEAIRFLEGFLNVSFPRSDGFDSCKYHDVGLGPHFHIQVAFDKNWEACENDNIRLVSGRKQ